jgi:hypothetical protein
MSLLRIETCLVPPAALGAAADAGALAGALGTEVAGAVPLQAVTTSAMTLSSINAARDPGLVPMVFMEPFLLLVRWRRLPPDWFVLGRRLNVDA